MNASDPSIVYVIDDDEAGRLAVYKLLRSSGLRAEIFECTQEFVNFRLFAAPSCLLLDVGVNRNGLGFQSEMPALGLKMPIVFVSCKEDTGACAKAMKAGAVDFLLKPYCEEDLLSSVNRALELDRQRLADEESMSELRAAYGSLSRREREVMALVVSGMLNKQIASAMCLSEITVKGHRGMIMKKMKAKSIADLVRKADALTVGRSVT
ncbi:response regulator transcription factor [Cupriavidus sp. IDO]|uniref:response regulator transcription factor n=1 Tax=Cupriavidus sp. IDO TaxID=1539142 RepID=UPI00068D27E9|nr:LuxR C-terminal-related transcriptional regulator [Cupriavidus sp. IDO]KWR86826.1 LuxR family transcriptional regulator [Cupriavidus sp. IDO]